MTDARKLAEQIYALLNLGGHVKYPNTTIALLEERFRYVQDETLERAAKLCYEEGVEYAIPSIGTAIPEVWHTYHTRQELARQIRAMKSTDSVQVSK